MWKLRKSLKIVLHRRWKTLMFTWRICSEFFSFIYLLVTLWKETNVSVGNMACSPPWKEKKEEKKKRKEKKKKGPPSRKQSKTDEANLFTQSHRNGIENVQNTAQPACSLCFNGDESNFRLKDFLTFRQRQGVSKLGPLQGYKGLRQGYWARITYLRGKIDRCFQTRTRKAMYVTNSDQLNW